MNHKKIDFPETKNFRKHEQNKMRTQKIESIMTEGFPILKWTEGRHSVFCMQHGTQLPSDQVKSRDIVIVTNAPSSDFCLDGFHNKATNRTIRSIAMTKDQNRVHVLVLEINKIVWMSGGRRREMNIDIQV